MSGRILDASGTPYGGEADPKDARIAELEALVAELRAGSHALTAKSKRDQVEDVVDMACAERRIVLPEVRAWALNFGQKNGVDALSAMLASFKPL